MQRTKTPSCFLMFILFFIVFLIGFKIILISPPFIPLFFFYFLSIIFSSSEICFGGVLYEMCCFHFDLVNFKLPNGIHYLLGRQKLRYGTGKGGYWTTYSVSVHSIKIFWSHLVTFVVVLFVCFEKQTF